MVVFTTKDHPDNESEVFSPEVVASINGAGLRRKYWLQPMEPHTPPEILTSNMGKAPAGKAGAYLLTLFLLFEPER